VRSLPLHTALEELIDQAAAALRAELAAGAEVPFELEPRVRRRGATQGPALYFYRALTDEFIARRAGAPERLPAYGPLPAQLAGLDRRDRHLAIRRVEQPRAAGPRCLAGVAPLARASASGISSTDRARSRNGIERDGMDAMRRFTSSTASRRRLDPPRPGPIEAPPEPPTLITTSFQAGDTFKDGTFRFDFVDATHVRLRLDSGASASTRLPRP